MTNSSRETDTNRTRGSDPVASPPKTGTQALRTDLSSGTAGDATPVAPRQFTATEVFDALRSAIAEMESTGKSATAAGVSARMRQLLHGYSVAATGFKTFRDLTQAAEDAGIITATRTSSDYVLSLVRSDDYQGETLLRDLWRAIQDWTEGVSYAFNRVTRKTERVHITLPPGAVAVPSVDKATSIQWMREFAATQHGDIANMLEAALSEEDPVDGFLHFMRDNDTIKRRWSKYLRSRVLDTAVTWATANGIPRADIFTRPAMKPAAQPASTSISSGDSRSDEEARRRVLEILSAMPLHELLRLPIPLAYALKR